MWLAACEQPATSVAISSVEPALACVSEDTQVLTIQGSGLGPVVVEGLTEQPALLTPVVTLRPVRALSGGETSLSPVVLGDGDGRVRVLGSDRLEVDLDPGLGLDAALYDVEVRATDGSTAAAPASLAFAGPPVIDAISPADACHAAEGLELTLTGADLVVVGGDQPVVLVDGDELPATAVADCAELPGGAQACRQVVTSIDPTTLPIGGLEVSARSAAPLDCQDAAPVELTIRPAPDIDQILPEQICDTGATVTVEGSGFVEGMTATLGGVAVDVVVVDEATLELTVPDGALSSGAWDLALSSEGGCEALLEDALIVSLAPIVFGIEPPVVPAGLPVTATARVTELFDELTDVLLVHEDGTEVAPAWSWDAAEPGIVEVVLPGDLAEGDWQIVVDQGEGCPGTPGAAVHVTTNLALPLDRVEAPYAWTYDYTSVDLYVEDPLPAGGVGFQAGARAWLVDPDGVGPTAALHGLTRRDDFRLSAVVPYLLPVDSYDLVVVNPDGSAGWLPAAVEVVGNAPPTITSVSPGTLSKSADQPVTIRGQDFRDPSVSITCLDGGVESSAAATVDAWSFSSIEATIPTTLYNEAVCTVEVQNADGTWARFSAISITNPAQNLFPWQVGSELTEARRAPATVAGRTTDTQRYLFAIGGDDGDEAGAKTSIEAAPVGVYGDLGAWRAQSRDLPEARTLAAVAIVDDFVYLVGGSDGASPVATTWRARVLDPLQVPWFEGLALAAGDSGLSPGTWVYRVSALFAADDPVNPGGESLAGDRLTITLPDLGTPWQPTLSWTAVDGAVGYRVYRTPSAASAPGDERWLGDVTDTRFTDTGGSTDATVLPLPEGSLGSWAEVATLTTERRSPCLAQAPDPHPDPDIVYLYAAGGRNDDGDLLDTIERLPITIESDTAQRVGEWELAEVTLSEARERCGAMAVDAAWHSVVETGESWVYFVGGQGSRSTSNEVDAFSVEENGELVDGGSVRQLTPARAGFAHASASNFLYVFGGQNDGPSSGGTSAELDADDLPDLRSWNSLGTSLSVARYLPGSAQESAVIFVVGGASDTADATSSVDWTNF